MENLILDGIVYDDPEQILHVLLDRGEVYTALQMMRATGYGKQIYLKYQLEQNGFKDIAMVRQYLSDNEFDSVALFEVLKKGKVEDIRIMNEFITAIQGKALEDRCMSLPFIWAAKRRLTLFEGVHENLKFSLFDFCFEQSITSLISKVVHATSNNREDIQAVIQQIFSILQAEVVQSYEEVMSILPVEYLDAHFLLRYLPPGMQIKQELSPFWKQLVYQRNGQADILVSSQVYHDVCSDLLEVGQPGKALVILQEALQRRGISSKELITLSLQVVEQSFVDLGHDDSEFHLKLLLSGSEDTIIEDVINLQVRTNSANFVQSYFDKAKWVFMTSESYYLRYQRQMFDCFKNAEKKGRLEYALALLLQILEHHTTLDLLFQVSKSLLTIKQKDQDIAQIALDFLYTSEAVSFKQFETLSSILAKLHEMTLSQNQGSLIKRFLTPQLHLYEEIFAKYKVEVTLRALLQIQVANAQGAKDELIYLIQRILDAQIKKSKNVKDKMIALSKLALSQGNQDEEGSSKWIQLLQDLLHLKDILSPKSEIDVYQLFMKAILSGRVIKSIEELITSGMIPTDEIQTSVLKYLQDQFNSMSREDFYKTAQTNKQFLELLMKHDPKKHYHSRIKEELKLIEVSFYLIQHEILVNELSWPQIRADFSQSRLIDRVLQVHGFGQFPDSLNTLTQIQEIVSQSNINEVISKVLKHMNSIRVFEAHQNFPEFLEDMINRLFLQRDADFSWINQDATVEILFKIGDKSSNKAFSKSIMKFLVRECDKQKDLFNQVCLNLIDKRNNGSQREDAVSQLLKALDENIPSKVRFIVNKHFARVIDGQQKFLDILSRGNFNHKQRKQLATILTLDQDLQEKVKCLKKENTEDFIRLFTNQKAFDEYVSKQKQAKKRQPAAPKVIEPQQTLDKSFESCEATPLQQLLKAETVIDASMVIDMEYSEWNGGIKFSQIIQDMSIESVRELNETATEALHQKVIDSNSNLAQQLTSLRAAQCDLPFNYLAIVDELSLNRECIWGSIMVENQSVLITEIRKVVTDTNLMSMSLQLEEYCSEYPSLVASCLYANKLECILKNWTAVTKMRDVSRQLYQYISKDFLEEMIEDERIIAQVNNTFRSQLPHQMDEEWLMQILIE